MTEAQGYPMRPVFDSYRAFDQVAEFKRLVYLGWPVAGGMGGGREGG